MSDQITIQELDKAAKNLARISEFLAARREWPLEFDAKHALGEARDAARNLGEFLTEMMMAQQIEPAAEAPPSPDPIPQGELSASRIAKFTGFLNQLLQWFEKHREGGAPLGGHDAMRSIHLFLGAVYGAIDSMLNPPEVSSPTPQAETSGSGAMQDYTEVDRGARLVLEDTPEEPLLQTFRGTVELTPEALEIIEVFFAVNQIELTEYEKRNHLAKIQQWIENTPEGQVLVLKISGLQGKPIPYSSYQTKESVKEETQ